MPTTADSADVVRPVKLAHVVLRTADVERLSAWWQTVLGAHVVHENPAVKFLTYDDEHHRLAIVGGGRERPAEGATGLAHFAFTYADLDDLVTTYERLAAEGIEPAWCLNHGMSLSMYYVDPDGNQVELQIDLCSPEEAEAFMASETFAANPIGIEFDPALLAKQHRAGDRPEALGLYGPRA